MGACVLFEAGCRRSIPSIRPNPLTQNFEYVKFDRVRFILVVSTDRRNTLAKSLCWRLEVQRFPGPLVELARHLVQLGLGVRRKIKALGEVLAQQSIGVFV